MYIMEIKILLDLRIYLIKLAMEEVQGRFNENRSVNSATTVDREKDKDILNLSQIFNKSKKDGYITFFSLQFAPVLGRYYMPTRPLTIL